MLQGVEQKKLIVNGKTFPVNFELDGVMLLEVLRNRVGLTGTHYACGMGLCGSCTVLVDGEAVRSCITPVQSVIGKKVVTVEGLATNVSGKEQLHPLQKAFIEHQVPQCGYCVPGQIMSATALLKRSPHPTEQEIKDSMSGNICRCGTYNRILKAIQSVAGEVS